MAERSIAREIASTAGCPFCGLPVEKPRELPNRPMGEMPVGTCSCGAVYACDETGHNLGAAMVEALIFGCNMDWDLAWSLLPEDDYQMAIVEHYDLVTHQVIPGGVFQGRRIAGGLFFVRLQEDIQEVTADGVKSRMKAAETHRHQQHSTPEKTGGRMLSREDVEKLVSDFNVDPILDAAGKDRRLIRNLQRLLYSGDELLRRRAAEVLGKVSAIVGDRDTGRISKLLQGLIYSITDTAASSWGAFEAIGEIIGHRPDLFAGYIPQLYQYLADESRRAAVLQTLGTIAKANPKLIRRFTFHFIPYLRDPNPAVRGYTARLLGNLGAYEAAEDIQTLLDESSPIAIYEEGILVKKPVSQVASEVMDSL